MMTNAPEMTNDKITGPSIRDAVVSTMKQRATQSSNRQTICDFERGFFMRWKRLEILSFKHRKDDSEAE